MSSLTRLLLNLSIGAKLGIASGLGVLLVATMVIVQIRANAAMRDLDARMAAQQTIARDAAEAKASLRGMQIGVRDLRLADSAADLQRAKDHVADRLTSLNKFADEMLRLSKSAENRTRIEKLKARAGDYEKGAQQIAAVRGEAIAAAGGGAEAAARVAKLNEEAVRIAREVTLPIVAEIEPICQPDCRFRQAQRGRANRTGCKGNGCGRMGSHGNRHRHDAAADRQPAYSPTSRSPVRCAH